MVIAGIQQLMLADKAPVPRDRSHCKIAGLLESDRGNVMVSTRTKLESNEDGRSTQIDGNRFRTLPTF